jgi:DNA processing protein
MGREVMAVPGLLTSAQSVGAHRLIQDGAALIQGWEDVVSQLPLRWRDRVTSTTIETPVSVSAPAATMRMATAPAGPRDPHHAEQSQLLGLIGEEPTDIDGIIERSGLTPGRASALLVTLEVEGRIRQLEGKRFVQVSLG